MMRIPVITLLILLLGTTGLAQVGERGSESPERLRQQVQPDGVVDADSKLRVAAAQHEIIAVLLEEGSFEEASAEYARILDLRLGIDYEDLLVTEAWWVVDSLRAAGEFELAHRALDATIGQLEKSENQFSLWMLKGKTFKDQGRLSEAVRAYRQAQRYQEE